MSTAKAELSSAGMSQPSPGSVWLCHACSLVVLAGGKTLEQCQGPPVSSCAENGELSLSKVPKDLVSSSV